MKWPNLPAIAKPEILGDLASIGRSKSINLIGATQHPTEKGTGLAAEGQLSVAARRHG